MQNTCQAYFFYFKPNLIATKLTHDRFIVPKQALLESEASFKYRVSLKKGSFRIPAPMEAVGCSKGLDISQKHYHFF